MDTTPATASQESPFDALRLTREDGAEYWSARDLQGALGYVQWRRFHDVILRAKSSARNSGVSGLDDLFANAGKEVVHGDGAKQIHADVHLSRYAAYLVAMNGDPNKPEIAAAQHYFAVRTREAELGSKPKEIDYLSLEPGQLAGMASALDDKADVLRELAGVMVRLREAESRFEKAKTGEEFNPFTPTEAPVISSRGHTRLEQILPWLTASNLRKSEDGLWWQTTTREVCIGAMRRDPKGVTGVDQAEAARALRQLGWERGTDPGVWQRRV